ncbi:MAG TPA: ATP-binding cassette domain-containing protein [Gammaproteobacteria bacterium]
MTSDSSPIIELSGVHVRVNGAALLHDIDWRLLPGEHWGVVGANGSGKTSFLGLLAGTLWPAPGDGERRYDFGDGPQRDAVQARQAVALVSHELQDRYARWGWNFSALDVVLSGVYRTDVPRRRPDTAERLRALALMRRLGIAALADRPFLELSRGEQRRVLIARGFAFRPAVLLLDEPASGLDRAARRELDAMLLAAVSAPGHPGERTPALVCTGHSDADLPRAVNRLLRLDRGRIVASGTFAAPPADAERVPGGASPATADAASARTAAAAEAPAPDGAPLVEVQHADVWLGSRRVLHDVTWRLSAGEHWLVTGGNGAGKSTFLRLLHGQLRPARGGRIAWPALGDPRNVWALRRQVAWLSPELQARYRFPSTVRQCVASGFESSIGLVREPTAAERERVEELLALFRLEALAERPTSTLSYGQFRRALIARALANGPRVLLLDEPWEGLDPAAAALLDEVLERVAAGGTQLVCASHLSRHLHHFTHELVLERGEIVAARAR